MILEQAMKNLYSRVAAAMPTVPVSLGLRRAGSETPAVVYELQSADMDCTMGGGLTVFRGTVAFHCVADLGSDALATLDDLIQAIDGNHTANNIQTTLVSMSINCQTSIPDDGQGDAERVASVVAIFHFRSTI